MSSGEQSPAAPLTAQQVQDLQVLVGQICTAALAQGFFVLLAGLAINALWHRAHDSIGVRFQIAAVVILFISTVVLLGMGMALNLGALTDLGPDPLPNSYFIKLVWLDILAPRVCYLLSDMIVVWRAWVITERDSGRYLLAASMTATFGCTIADAYFTLDPIYAAEGADVPKHPLYNLILFIPILTTNILATLLILHKAWVYRRSIKIHLQGRSPNVQIEQMFNLLVESGALYAAFWTANLIMGVLYESDPHPPVVVLVFRSLLPRVSAIYPTAIILLVASSRSKVHLTDGSIPSDTIQFTATRSDARRSVTTTTNHTTSIIQSLVNRIHVDPPHQPIDEESWIEMNRVAIHDGPHNRRSDYSGKGDGALHKEVL